MATATEERRSPSRSHRPSTGSRIDWRTAVGYVAREPEWKLRVGIGGLLILVLPPVGWALALGYRRIVGQRIVDREHPLPPPWADVFGSVAAFPPLALPGMPALYAARYDWLQFSAWEIALLTVLFFGPIVLLPSAFLQVSQQRRFSAAFHVGRVARLIHAAPALYLQAWIGALAVSAVAVIVVPLMPWLLFWSYLAISHLFLQVPARLSPAPLLETVQA